MMLVYGHNFPSYDTVRRWSVAVKTRHNSLRDKPRTGRPSTAVTSETIDAVEDMIAEDRRSDRAQPGP